MVKSNKKLLESEVNELISEQMQSAGLLVLQRVRLHPTELDIVLFDPKTLRLAALEIKRANWRKLLDQTIRAKLYCHFSIAVMPISTRPTLQKEAFAQEGIGMIFYEESNERLNLITAIRPKLSNSINRPLKQQVYLQFCSHYGDNIYA